MKKVILLLILCVSCTPNYKTKISSKLPELKGQLEITRLIIDSNKIMFSKQENIDLLSIYNILLELQISTSKSSFTIEEASYSYELAKASYLSGLSIVESKQLSIVDKLKLDIIKAKAIELDSLVTLYKENKNSDAMVSESLNIASLLLKIIIPVLL